MESVGAVAGRSAHRLDAGTDHEILVAGADAHRREGDRLLAGAAEPVQRDARNRDRPAGVEHRHATDVVRMVAGVRTVAAHDVVDVDRVESDAVAQPVRDLPENLLRVQVSEAALALFADAARRTHRVDDPCFADCHPIVLLGRRGAAGSATVGRIASHTASSSNPNAHSATPSSRYCRARSIRRAIPSPST